MLTYAGLFCLTRAEGKVNLLPRFAFTREMLKVETIEVGCLTSPSSWAIWVDWIMATKKTVAIFAGREEPLVG